MKKCFLVSLVVFSFAAVGNALGQVQYTVTDLGPTFDYPFGLNNSGQVVGYGLSGSVTQAFLWSAGSTQDLDTFGGSYSYAAGINNSGQIVGVAQASGGSSDAFLYSSGSMQNLGTFGGPGSWADGLNNSGQVVGSAYTSSYDIYGYQINHAFLYSGG